MTDIPANDTAADKSEWVHDALDTAVERITSLGIIPGDLVEARPIWSIPNRVMIGQLREKRNPATAYWIIAGAGPTDFIDLAVAATPRDAARHFSLKWQLDAARYADPGTKKVQDIPQQEWDRLATALRAQAEALYALSDNADLWQEPGSIDQASTDD